jgi:leader peptidase (prepilin peptidase) / N-methyltransferase
LTESASFVHSQAYSCLEHKMGSNSFLESVGSTVVLNSVLTIANENTVAVSSSMLLLIVFGSVSYFDFRYLIIPNFVNAALLLSGLFVASLRGTEEFVYATLGAIGIVMFFYAFVYIYAKFRGRDGLGMGDVKFIAAASTWVGLSGMPWLLLIASSAALMHALFKGISSGKFNATTRLPFGPYLALSLLIVWHFQTFEFFGEVPEWI